VLQRAQNGVEDDEAAVWSLQTIVRPSEDMRVLSVYSCDASGLERSDIFGRSYSKLYPWTFEKDVTLPCLETLTADRCLQVSAERRASIEAKTLGIVRFASRFHHLEFEGLVLEFVFDSNDNSVLHGCWNASLFGPDLRRKIRSGGLTGRAPCVPRMFPVPSVVDAVAAEASAEARSLISKSSANSEQERDILLEVWRGEEFLGEASVPAGSGEHRLRLRAAADIIPTCTRSDKRKESSAVVGSGSVLVGVDWLQQGDRRHPLLRFALRRADGLTPVPGAAAGSQHTQLQPRALLWLRQPGTTGWLPLWASRDGGEGEEISSFLLGGGSGASQTPTTAATWDEVVELAVEDPTPMALPDVVPTSPGQAKRSGGPASPGSKVGTRAGTSLGSSGRSAAAAGSATTAGGAAETAEEAAGLPASLRSAKEHICGAEWTTHWGTSETDGTMRGSVLATQVAQRLGMERISRSLLLTQVSQQVDQFGDMQRAWEEEVEKMRARSGTNSVELQGKQDESDRIRKETKAMMEEQEKKLAQACREMCGALDEHRIQEQLDDIALEQCKQRINEQRTIVHQLVDKSHALQGSLDRTVRKFDEVSSSYAQVQGDLMRSQVVRPRAVKELSDSLGQAQEISEEVGQEQKKFEDTRSKLVQLQDDLHNEREFSLRLEDFVRRIAAAPPARLRTGGGWQLDSTAKSEAAALLREMSQAAEAEG